MGCGTSQGGEYWASVVFPPTGLRICSARTGSPAFGPKVPGPSIGITREGRTPEIEPDSSTV